MDIVVNREREGKTHPRISSWQPLPGWMGQSLFFLSILIFKKNSKRRRFSKKKKSQRVATRILTGFCQVGWVTPDHDFFYFFINLARFQLQVGRVLSRPTKPGFKTMLETTTLKYKNGESFDVF
jgi:hypothetical protein